MVKKITTLIWLGLFYFSGKSQDLVYSDSNFGFNVGANFALGSHFQRFGINFNFYYYNKNFQANTEARFYFNFKNPGPQKIYAEMALAQGLVIGFGNKQNYFNPFINSVSNQTGYNFSAAYSYNLYLNSKKTIKTKQQTGIIAFQIKDIALIIENDILARPILDRFRTGAFLIQYQYQDVFQAAVNCTMWTGAMGKTVRENPDFPWGCYIDTTGGTYTNISHGMLSAQLKYHMGLSQIIQANVGIDAEQVRNAMQNKLIHEVFFLPKNWFKRYNCHIPMIDTQGNQYLYQSNQKIKKPQFYWNVMSNANLFY